MATGHKDWFPVVVITGEIAGLFKNIAVDANGNLKLSTRSFDGTGIWATEGEKSNPSQYTILADTGQLAAGFYRFDAYIVTLGTLGDQCHELQHRNAANDANIKGQLFHSGGSPALQLISFPYLEMAANERMRVQAIVAHTTDVQASIFFWKYV